MQHTIIGPDAFLNRQVDLYYHDNYYGYKSPKNRLVYLNVLKNDLLLRNEDEIMESEALAAAVLSRDLVQLVQQYGALTVCGIPRSKSERSYDYWQMGLKRAIRRAVSSNRYLHDGLDYIERRVDTLCTHLSRSGRGGEGESPRPGLIGDTCIFSRNIAGKHIVLVDDIYTPGVGIDEDCIQALLNLRASNVIMYAYGYTVKNETRYSSYDSGITLADLESSTPSASFGTQRSSYASDAEFDFFN